MSEVFADQQFLHFVIKQMVDHPEDIEITRKVDELGVLLELKVNPEDTGKVIGKGGQTIKALRILLRVAGSKNDGARTNLRLVESAE